MSGYGPPRGWRGSNAWGAPASRAPEAATVDRDAAPDPQVVREIAREAIRQAVAFRTWTRLLDMPDVRIYVEADPTVSGGIIVTAKPTGQRLINEIVARASAPVEQPQQVRDGDEAATRIRNLDGY